MAVGSACRLPPLSFGGASLADPWLRFHTPLIEPDMQISRIRLSDKTSRLHPSRHISLPRKGRRVGLHIVLFEACSAFTRVAACTFALSPIRDMQSEGFSHFVTSMTTPVAFGRSDRRVGLAPNGKRRLTTAHTRNGHSERLEAVPRSMLT